MSETKTTNRRTIAYALLGALLLATVAYWVPWIDHDAAALKLSGQDLGEFVKFLPAIRRGTMRFPRQAFYTPVFAAICVLLILSTTRHLPYPRWLRVLLIAWAVILLPGLLPPAWGRPRDLFTPEFRLQGLALALACLLVAAHGLLSRLPQAALAPLLAALALLGLLPAEIAFWAVRPRIWAAYDPPPLRLGWGPWLHLVAWTIVLVLALVAWARPRRIVRHS